LHNLAQMELRRNNPQRAEEYSRRALEYLENSPDAYVQSLCMLTSADIEKRRGNLPGSEQLLQMCSFPRTVSQMQTKSSNGLLGLLKRLAKRSDRKIAACRSSTAGPF